MLHEVDIKLISLQADKYTYFNKVGEVFDAIFFCNRLPPLKFKGK